MQGLPTNRGTLLHTTTTRKASLHLASPDPDGIGHIASNAAVSLGAWLGTRRACRAPANIFACWLPTDLVAVVAIVRAAAVCLGVVALLPACLLGARAPAVLSIRCADRERGLAQALAAIWGALAAHSLVD